MNFKNLHEMNQYYERMNHGGLINHMRIYGNGNNGLGYKPDRYMTGVGMIGTGTFEEDLEYFKMFKYTPEEIKHHIKEQKKGNEKFQWENEIEDMFIALSEEFINDLEKEQKDEEEANKIENNKSYLTKELIEELNTNLENQGIKRTIEKDIDIFDKGEYKKQQNIINDFIIKYPVIKTDFLAKYPIKGGDFEEWIRGYDMKSHNLNIPDKEIKELLDSIDVLKSKHHIAESEKASKVPKMYIPIFRRGNDPIPVKFNPTKSKDETSHAYVNKTKAGIEYLKDESSKQFLNKDDYERNNISKINTNTNITGILNRERNALNSMSTLILPDEVRDSLKLKIYTKNEQYDEENEEKEADKELTTLLRDTTGLPEIYKDKNGNPKSGKNVEYKLSEVTSLIYSNTNKAEITDSIISNIAIDTKYTIDSNFVTDNIITPTPDEIKNGINGVCFGVKDFDKINLKEGIEMNKILIATYYITKMNELEFKLNNQYITSGEYLDIESKLQDPLELKRMFYSDPDTTSVSIPIQIQQIGYHFLEDKIKSLNVSKSDPILLHHLEGVLNNTSCQTDMKYDDDRNLIGYEVIGKTKKQKEKDIVTKAYNEKFKFNDGAKYTSAYVAVCNDAVGIFDFTKSKLIKKGENILDILKMGNSQGSTNNKFVLVPCGEYIIPKLQKKKTKKEINKTHKR